MTLFGKNHAASVEAHHQDFYKDFEDLVASNLTDMLNEAHEWGALPAGVRQGDIIVLYKKGDAREVRNYRPITLLCCDYKVMSKVLVNRLKPVMDEIVSAPQLGFVPGRVHTASVVPGGLECGKRKKTFALIVFY